MALRVVRLLACAVCIFGGSVYASPLPVTFIGGEVPLGPGSNLNIPVTLPVLLGGNADSGLPDFVGDTLFLKFKIPDIATVVGINSFEVDIAVFDDNDPGGESTFIDFAQPGANVFLTPTFTILNGTTRTSPLVLQYFLTSDQIGQVFPTLTDGNFRIRILRNTGDFEVLGGSATIDATFAQQSVVPEPSSLLLFLAGGVCAGVSFYKRRGGFQPSGRVLNSRGRN